MEEKPKEQVWAEGYDEGSLANHQIDAKTGYIVNPAYAHNFDGQKKVQFLKLYRDNGLRLYDTCRKLGLSVDTIHKHNRIDSKFHKDMKEQERAYFDDLEGISRENALNPKMVIERIFQLKSHFPGKYGDQKRENSGNITINVDGKALAKAMDHKNNIENSIDAKIVDKSPVTDEKESASYDDI